MTARHASVKWATQNANGKSTKGLRSKIANLVRDFDQMGIATIRHRAIKGIKILA